MMQTCARCESTLPVAHFPYTALMGSPRSEVCSRCTASMTQQQVGDTLGVSHQTVGRSLNVQTDNDEPSTVTNKRGQAFTRADVAGAHGDACASCGGAYETTVTTDPRLFDELLVSAHRMLGAGWHSPTLSVSDVRPSCIDCTWAAFRGGGES